jgi:hypothetical protein
MHLLLGLLQRVDERDAARAALPRVRRAERFLQELVDRSRAGRLLRRAVALAADLARLNGENDGDADEKEEDAGGRGESETVAGDELADLVGGAGRVRQDWPIREVSLDVLGEGVGGPGPSRAPSR